MGGQISSYPEYKLADAPWIGDYPSSWTLTRVKFVTYVKARVGWHGLKSDDFTDEGPYLVTGSDFIGPTIEWKNCYHCDIARYDQDPYIQLQNGDLLITKDGTIGKVALVKNLDDKATLNSGVFVVRPVNGSYVSAFYFWLLQSTVFTGFVDYNKTGSTILHLYQDTFVNFKYALPSLPEQTKIAAFLDYETGKIDALIGKQERLIALLEEKRQAVISHAVTKGLDPTAPLRPSGIDWLGDVPAHWEMMALSRLTLDKCDGPFGSGLKSSHYTDSGARVIRLQNIRATHFDNTSEAFIDIKYFEKNLSGHDVKSGDLLFAGLGDDRNLVGRACVAPVGIEPALVKADCFRFRIDTKRFDPTFAALQLSSTAVVDSKELSSGSTRSRIPLSLMASRKILLPPICEQEVITLFVQEQEQRFGELFNKAQSAIALLKERRTALISAAVTGKIDLRDWQAPAAAADNIQDERALA